MASFQLGENWTDEYKGMDPEEASKIIISKHPNAQV